MGFLDFLKKKKPEKKPPVDLDAVEKKIQGGDVDVPLPPNEMRDPTFGSPGGKPVPGEKPKGDPDFSIPPPKDKRPEPSKKPLGEGPPPPVPGEEGLKGLPDGPPGASPAVKEHESPKKPVQPVPEEPAGTSPKEKSPKHEPPKPAPEKPAGPSSPLDLPDFTEEDIAELDHVAQPSHEEFRPPKQEPEGQGKPELRKPVPPEQEMRVPRPEPIDHGPAFHNLDPGMFLSSDDHFELKDGISDLRKKMRKCDKLMSSMSSGHGKMETQLERIAKSMNTVQERLIEIDGALFEE